MKIQKCNIDERNKIDLLIPKLHAAKPGEQAEREPHLILKKRGEYAAVSAFLISWDVCFFCAVEIWM